MHFISDAWFNLQYGGPTEYSFTESLGHIEDALDDAEQNLQLPEYIQTDFGFEELRVDNFLSAMAGRISGLKAILPYL